MKKLPWCHDTDAKLAGLWPKSFLIGRDDGHRIASALAIHGQLQHLMIVVSTYVPSLLSRHAYVRGQLERGDGALGVDVLSAALGLAEIHRELGGLAAMQVVLFNRYFIILLSTLTVKLTEFKTCMGFILEASSRHLIFHGAVVLVAALLYGAPYAKAIKSESAAQVVNSWRVAHQSLCLGAILMFSVAAVLPFLSVSASLKWLIVASFITSSYALTIATPLAAITQDRGLAKGGQGWARLVYWGNITGAWTSLLGAAALLLAAGLSL